MKSPLQVQVQLASLPRELPTFHRHRWWERRPRLAVPPRPFSAIGAGGEHNTSTTTTTTTTTTTQSRGDSFTFLDRLKLQEDSGGKVPGEKQYCKEIHNLAGHGEWLEARAVLLAANERLGPQEGCFRTLMKCMNRAGNTAGALSLLDDVWAAGITPDVRMYTSVMTNCLRARAPSDALSLMWEMMQRGIEPDAFAFSVAIHAAVQLNRPLVAVELLDIMLETEGFRGGRGVDRDSHHLIMMCLAKNRDWERCVASLDTMHTKAGIPPVVKSYAIALDACARERSMEPALGILERMYSAGLTPNEACYSSALLACARHHDKEVGLAKCRDLLASAGERGVPLNARCFSPIIKAAGRAGQWYVAVNVIDSMLGSDLPPNRLCWCEAITACGCAGQAVVVGSLLDRMHSAGLLPDKLTVRAVSSLLVASTRKGRGVAQLSPHEALSFTGSLPNKGLSAPDILCEAMLTLWKDWLGAVTLLEAAEARGDEINQGAYKAAVQACINAGQEEEASFIMGRAPACYFPSPQDL
jgi:pentatricopeptide repeat protein